MALRRSGAHLMALAALACSCPTTCWNEDIVVNYVSTSERWNFGLDGLQFDPCERPGRAGMQEHEAFLAGSRWCPQVSCSEGSGCYVDNDAVAACYTTRVTGPAEVDELCLEFTGTGEVQWSFDPIPCTYPGIFLPEQIRVHAAAPADIHGRLVSYLDRMGRRYMTAEQGDFPEDLEPAADAGVFKVAADEPVHVNIELRAGARRVAWFEGEAELQVELVRGAAPEVALGERSTLFLRVPAASEAALSLVLGETIVPLGRVIGVPADALAELEVVIAYGREEDFGVRAPAAARAVVRDREGDLVYGARAEWEVLAGSFPFAPAPVAGDVVANRDYISLLRPDDDDEDAALWCFTVPSSGSLDYTGRIAARVGELAAEVELAWTVVHPPPAGADDLFADAFRGGPNQHCEGPGFPGEGCSCRSERGGAAPGLFGLLVLAAIRRRRPNSPRSAPAARARRGR